MNHNGETTELAPTPPQAPPPVPVDLGAWARGQAEFPIYEVQRAIEDRSWEKVRQLVERAFASTQERHIAAIARARTEALKDREAAVRFAIEEGLIAPTEARQDV
jgi:hypothetical protein